MSRRREIPELAGVAEIASAFSVNRSAVYYWTRQPGFPEPVAELSTGRVWVLDAVRVWRSDRDRGGARPGPKPAGG
jgi:hypothetical protein